MQQRGLRSPNLNNQCRLSLTLSANPSPIAANPFARSSRMLNLISTSLHPREITFNLLMAMKWLYRDANRLSRSSDSFGADMMFPILVTALVHAQIPNMNQILHFIHSFVGFDGQGKVTIA